MINIYFTCPWSYNSGFCFALFFPLLLFMISTKPEETWASLRLRTHEYYAAPIVLSSPEKETWKPHMVGGGGVQKSSGLKTNKNQNTLPSSPFHISISLQ